MVRLKDESHRELTDAKQVKQRQDGCFINSKILNYCGRVQLSVVIRRMQKE